MLAFANQIKDLKFGIDGPSFSFLITKTEVQPLGKIPTIYRDIFEEGHVSSKDLAALKRLAMGKPYFLYGAGRELERGLQRSGLVPEAIEFGFELNFIRGEYELFQNTGSWLIDEEGRTMTYVIFEFFKNPPKVKEKKFLQLSIPLLRALMPEDSTGVIIKSQQVSSLE